MPSAAPTQQPLVASVDAASGFSGPAGEGAPRAQAAQLSATGAVESALQIADLQAAQSQGTQSAVALRFNVGGENLSVRVALQAGWLHTQFRTDSGELRDALAQEWHSVESEPQAPVRFAEPVFASHTGTDSRNTPDMGGDAGRQAGQQRSQRGEEAELPIPAPKPARAAVTSSVAEPAAAQAASSSPRLQSFA
jgi:hypothetical protein